METLATPGQSEVTYKVKMTFHRAFIMCAVYAKEERERGKKKLFI